MIELQSLSVTKPIGPSLVSSYHGIEILVQVYQSGDLPPESHCPKVLGHMKPNRRNSVANGTR